MRSFLYHFEERPLIRAWPASILITGKLEVLFDRDGWYLGSVQVECYRHGEHVETRCWHESSRRAGRIHDLVLNDALLCNLIDEEISEIFASDAELAAEQRCDECRVAMA